MADFVNSVPSTLITGTSYADTITNSAGGVTIKAGEGDDSIYSSTYPPNTINNSYGYVTIDAGTGNDTIYSCDPYVSVFGGVGNDSIYNNWSSYVTINGGDGNDTILTSGGSVNGGSGSDIISITGYNNSVTIKGGGDYDTIYGRSDDTIGSLYRYTSGDGYDLIVGYKSLDLISIDDSSEYTRSTVGSDVVVSLIGGGSITLDDASDKTINISGGTFVNAINNLNESIAVSGTSGNDSIINSGSNVSINAGAGNDSIYNGGSYVTIAGGSGRDTIENYASYVTINGGDGDDSIYSGNYSAMKLNGDAGNDTLHTNSDGGKTLTGGEGSDLFRLYYDNDSLYGTDIIIDYTEEDTIQVDNVAVSAINVIGNNVIFAAGNNSIQVNDVYGKVITYIDSDGTEKHYGEVSKLISGTSGADSIYNTVEGATIEALGGSDTILNDGGASVSINGGAGDDSIRNYGKYATLEGGNGSDSLDNFVGYVLMNCGAGNDTVWSAYAPHSTINGGDDNDELNNYRNSSLTAVNGGAGDDSIRNYAANVTISGGTGNDYIYNQYTTKVTINTGAGSDTIYSWGGQNGTIDGGAGNDYIHIGHHVITDEEWFYGSQNLINGGAGNDSIRNWGASATINGGVGNDSLLNYGEYSTIIGGSGNDTIYNNWDFSTNSPHSDDYAWNAVFKYSSGDGNDKIYGFKADSTLQIGGGKGTYSSQTSGNNIIVTVGNGKISLMGAASLSTVNIDGKEESKNEWKLSGTTATYGTSSNTLIKLTNIKSLVGVSLSGKVVTIAKSAVNAKKITLTGDGYTLALADDVTKRTTKKAAWTYSDGTATYKSSYKTAGYTLASNAKSITYSKAETPSTLATVKGVKSKSGLTVSGKVITVAESSVNKKKITLTSDDYKLKLADGLTPTTKKAAWSLNSTTATYKSSYKTAGYKLASNAKSITYSPATTSTTLAQVKGAKAKPTISNSIIKLKTSTINSKVTLSGSYEFDFASGDYKKAKILGSSSADKITSHGKNISLNGGDGNDTIKIYGSATSIKGGSGADVFVFDGGSGIITDYAAEDKISIVSGTVSATTSGDNVILSAGSKKITVKGGKDKTISYFDADGEHTYQKAPDTLEGVKFTKSGKVVTLTDDYEANKFSIADFSNYASKIITINAANVPRGLEITANSNSNSITGTNDKDKIYGLDGADTIRGGKGGDYIKGGNGDDELYGGTGSDSLWGGEGDDILTGGSGNDFFIYEGNDDGHDTITDYADIDRIMILSGEKPALAYTPQSNNMTFNIGNGSIVIENPQGQNINFVKGDGTYLHHEAVIRSAH